MEAGSRRALSRADSWPAGGTDDERSDPEDVQCSPERTEAEGGSRALSSDGLLHAKVGARTIAYRTAGQGTPLVLLHGFLCDSRCWRAQLAGLADDFKVVAWDAPGAGASPDPDEPFTITDWAHALADFLDAVGITRTHLLGLSWGGMLAQELFRLHPSRVDRLLLAATYAGWKGSLPQEAVEQKRARCYRDAWRHAREVVSWRESKDIYVKSSPNLAGSDAMLPFTLNPTD